MGEYYIRQRNFENCRRLTLHFEQEPPRQKTKVMSGQASQKVMVEINKLVDKGVTEYTEPESLYRQFSFVQNLMEPAD